MRFRDSVPYSVGSLSSFGSVGFLNSFCLVVSINSVGSTDYFSIVGSEVLWVQSALWVFSILSVLSVLLSISWVL